MALFSWLGGSVLKTMMFLYYYPHLLSSALLAITKPIIRVKIQQNLLGGAGTAKGGKELHVHGCVCAHARVHAHMHAHTLILKLCHYLRAYRVFYPPAQGSTLHLFRVSDPLYSKGESIGSIFPIMHHSTQELLT